MSLKKKAKLSSNQILANMSHPCNFGCIVGASERNITCEKSRQPVNRPSAYPAGHNFIEESRRYAE